LSSDESVGQRAAQNHVNRMCLALKVLLIDSDVAGCSG
uniref:Transcriptional regulator n=1 Tax=Angiostrongylus cantonensis TaxID=6313 RepID=A0A0K0D4M6_ANGCA